MKTPVESNLAALHAILEGINRRNPAAEGPDKPAAKHYAQVTGTIEGVVDAANALRKLHVTRNPNDTDAVHFKRVSTAAAKVARQIDISDSAVKVAWAKAKADVANRRVTALRLNPDGYAAEIRAAFRALSRTERIEVMMQLTKDTTRGPELAALLRAPSIITGLTPEEQSNYWKGYSAANAQAENDEEELIDTAYDDAIAALNTAREVITTYTDEKKLADIAKREAEAAAAAANFEAKVTL